METIIMFKIKRTKKRKQISHESKADDMPTGGDFLNDIEIQSVVLPHDSSSDLIEKKPI